MSNRRSEMESAMIRSIVAHDSSWVVDWNMIPDMARKYSETFPGITLVADGRPCAFHAKQGHISREDPVCAGCPDCFLLEGRSTTLVDLFRQGPVPFLSLKGHRIGKDRKLASWAGLLKGNLSTLLFAEQAFVSGSSLPFLAYNSADGDFSNGFAFVLDLGEIVREHGIVRIDTDDPFRTWGRGKAPACYHAMSDPQGSGEERAAKLREMFGENLVEHTGWDGECYHHSAESRSYPMIRLNLSKKWLRAYGVSWTPVALADLGRFIQDRLPTPTSL